MELFTDTMAGEVGDGRVAGFFDGVLDGLGDVADVVTRAGFVNGVV